MRAVLHLQVQTKLLSTVDDVTVVKPETAEMINSEAIICTAAVMLQTGRQQRADDTVH